MSSAQTGARDTGNMGRVRTQQATSPVHLYHVYQRANLIVTYEGATEGTREMNGGHWRWEERVRGMS